MQQLQDMITTLNEELEASKEKLGKLEGEVNEVDFNTKKNMDELWDKVQVERCVQEMVSWVSEQQTNNDTIKLFNNLNKQQVASGKKDAVGDDGA